ncbi:peptide deformylase [Desulfovibrio sulfodismutans]|uniref:Peptide deformylase n=1 Tax=Desulfolutivibrio sulfodismutans TaxID=63561 RepID=A0A7K3NRC3_9BACT|nr:peptide deformylase [Desulfolutivibrio sulfodismutans]NDY58750.1 peptide deformylase [Desulfolutivibrio sulfodismutans]QLA13145.1 peptide deformylase [Desulfolutivibrio sulfodismutans DSM 3696]
MTRDIVKYPHPVLAQKAARIEEITPEIMALASDMAETMYVNQGIGLAANQVAEPVRLITVDISGPDKREELFALVNPEIVSAEGETETEEGCLSVKDYRSNVVRAEKVRVRGLDLSGNEVCLDAEGLLAVCLQHEIDHLEGTLFIDRISRLKRALYDKRARKWARKADQD